VLTLVELVVPAVVIFTTLFGLLARGNPKPGGVALFLRVGLAGLALAGAVFYLVEKTAALGGRSCSTCSCPPGSISFRFSTP